MAKKRKSALFIWLGVIAVIVIGVALFFTISLVKKKNFEKALSNTTAELSIKLGRFDSWKDSYDEDIFGSDSSMFVDSNGIMISERNVTADEADKYQILSPAFSLPAGSYTIFFEYEVYNESDGTPMEEWDIPVYVQQNLSDGSTNILKEYDFTEEMANTNFSLKDDNKGYKLHHVYFYADSDIDDVNVAINLGELEGNVKVKSFRFECDNLY